MVLDENSGLSSSGTAVRLNPADTSSSLTITQPVLDTVLIGTGYALESRRLRSAIRLPAVSAETRHSRQ